MLSVAETQTLAPQFDYEAFELPENTALNFRLSPHSHAKDLPDPETLSNAFRETDVIVLECISSSGRDVAKSFQKISQGDANTYQRFRTMDAEKTTFNSWMVAIYQALYGSRTPVTTIDVGITHPGFTRFQTVSAAWDKAIEKARDEEGVIATSGLYAQYLDVVKTRDQSILGNIKPRLDALITGNRKLETKRASEPLDVSIYYGSLHKSLFDATVHKAKIAPAQGFSVRLDPSSTIRESGEQLYANYLRTGTIDNDLLIRKAKLLFMSTVLVTYQQVASDMPTVELENYTANMVAGMSYAEVREIGNEIATHNKAVVWNP